MSSPLIINCNLCNSKCDHEKSLLCNICEKYYHGQCVNVSKASFDLLQKLRNSILWMCPSCKQIGSKLVKMVSTRFERQSTMEADIADLKEKVSSLSQSDSSTVRITEQSTENCLSNEKLASELEDRNRRAQNAIISGLAVGNDLSVDVAKFVDTLNVNKSADNILKVWKLSKSSDNKSSLIGVRFKSVDVRDSILRAARARPRQSVLESRIYVNPDLTLWQRERLKNAKAEFKRRKAAGEKVRLKGLEIVELIE